MYLLYPAIWFHTSEDSLSIFFQLMAVSCRSGLQAGRVAKGPDGLPPSTCYGESLYHSSSE